MKKKAENTYLNHFTHLMRRNAFQSDKWDLALGKNLWVPKVPPDKNQSKLSSGVICGVLQTTSQLVPVLG